MYGLGLGLTAAGFVGLWVSYCWYRAKRINALYQIRIQLVK